MKSAQTEWIKNSHTAKSTSTAMDKKTNAKPEMHHRNPHNIGYDFVKLSELHPPIKDCLAPNPMGKLTIDFSQPSAVKALNAGLLKQFYQVEHWDIPDGFLCPAVPGRADYIHYLADLLGQDNGGNIPQGKQVRGLDIGTGANLIYPIVASQSYGWNMIGSDINEASYASASLIVESNSNLRKLVKVRLQKQQNAIFSGIVKENESFDFSLCNPPFHISADAALTGSRKKNKNLARHSHKRRGKDSTAKNQSSLNFGGQHNELWCEGGEFEFVKNMINESVEFKNQVTWFTSLLSKKENVAPLLKLAEKRGATECKQISMAQGAKATRFIAWRF
ncbi:MAG: 23S rRNA (adenine1618-N6)-methyltransferase [Glaciecola sp.]|jgi:23S rRNA (adenine1618-N6)-methyltransferase